MFYRLDLYIYDQNSDLYFSFSVQEILRIINALSTTVKSDTPGTKLRPGEQDDINAVLSVMEDLIQQNNTSDTSESEAQTQGVFLLWTHRCERQQQLYSVLTYPSKEFDTFC